MSSHQVRVVAIILVALLVLSAAASMLSGLLT